MRVFNALLDGRGRPGHDSGWRFAAKTAVFSFKRERLNTTQLTVSLHNRKARPAAGHLRIFFNEFYKNFFRYER
ncbi:MAG: hypothetical protein WAN43_16645 [Rhodomicrobium sp.]|jgi:hypothetical protein